MILQSGPGFRAPGPLPRGLRPVEVGVHFRFPAIIVVVVSATQAVLAALQAEDGGTFHEFDDPVHFPARVSRWLPDFEAIRAQNCESGAFQEEMVCPLRD